MNQTTVGRLLDLQNQIVANFALKLEVAEIIADQIAVSRSATLTVFLASDDQLYGYVETHGKAVLADVTKMLNLAGLVANKFFPPFGRQDYFYETGLEQFKKVYPGRRLVSEEDLDFYKTLAPYNPALVQIKQVKSGRIKTYDADVKGGWRTYCKFYYNKIDVK